MTISERIFSTLREQNKTQTALANAIGVRVATVSAWKAQSTDPSANLIAPIAKFLGVSCDFICTGKESATAAVHQQGIFGDRNENNTVTINGDGAVKLTEFESELLRVYSSLDTQNKTALLMHAYELSRKGASGV